MQVLFIKIVAIVIFLSGTFFAGWGVGVGKLKEKLEVQRLQSVEKAAEIKDKAEKEAEELRKKRDADKLKILTDLDTARSELRKRPTRTIQVAGPACTGGTGAGLSREDAEFLAGEAARANELRAFAAEYQGWIEKVKSLGY